MGEAILGIFWAVVLLVAFAAGVALYMAPTIFAAARRHPHVWGIGIVNFFGGALFGVGWIAALVWACTLPGDRGHGDVTVTVQQTPGFPAPPWYAPNVPMAGISWVAPPALESTDVPPPHGFAPRHAPLSTPRDQPDGPSTPNPSPPDSAA